MWRLGLFLLISAASMGAQGLADEWYPRQPHTIWVYQNEAPEGDMRHPDFERWTTEETIVSAVSDPVSRGIVVTKRITVSADTLSAKYDPVNDYAKRERSETRELIWQNCVYSLDGVFGNNVVEGKVPADFCFPMAQGRVWGRIAGTSPAEEFVWRVKGKNTDPFGVAGRNYFPHRGARRIRHLH